MSQFNPKRVLRHVSRPLLKEFFERQGQPLAVGWDQPPERLVEEIFSEWQNLPDTPRKEIEILLQDTHEMATEDGVKIIVEVAQYDGLELADDLNELESRYDMAVWTLLNHRGVWDNALRFAQADGLATGRYWDKRGELPKVVPNVSPTALGELEAAVSSFFRQREGRGHRCRVEHLLRRNRQDYFFVYLSDYADVYLSLDDHNNLVRAPERRVFEVVFAYDREQGTLEMYARGGRKVVEPLQRAFCRVVLGQDVRLSGDGPAAYQLDKLMDDNGFPTDPEDGILEVSVRSLRLSVVGQQRGRITLEADPEKGRRHIYNMIENYLNKSRLHRSILHVTRATLHFRLSGNGHGRSLTFAVGFPNSCNLKSKREDQRVLGEKYLREWGIDVAAAPMGMAPIPTQ
jgi:hypothetical protein